RNFGMKMLTMTNLSTECLIQLTKLGYDATPFNQILKQNAKREMRLRLGKVTVEIGRAVQQECRDRSRMPSSAGKKKDGEYAGMAGERLEFFRQLRVDNFYRVWQIDD